jgi:hypothetical protein
MIRTLSPAGIEMPTTAHQPHGVVEPTISETISVALELSLMTMPILHYYD